jgi:enamine deaminase RidA (YjgF/YER057c/UK114 family)
MEQVEFVVTPGFGERLSNALHYSQAVKIGNKVELSGQGGWTDEIDFPADWREQYALAFANVGRVLRASGADWKDVVSIVSYHVDLDDDAMAIMAEQFRKHMPNHRPTWTCLGVARLGDARMRVEIRVSALVRNQE